MKNLVLIFLTAIVYPQTLTAQFSVDGKLTDIRGEALPFANVLLLASPDSSFITGQTSNEDGSFIISTPQQGNYFLSSSVIGYETYYSEIFSLSGANPKKSFGIIVMEEGGIELEAVEVTADKPLIIREIDRTVINIENRVSTAGASLLEVLERSPGVVVNRQSNSIAMLGKDGVNVMINGKFQYMPPDALFNYLEGLSADNIRSIELITTPPANYDAQGNAGYINIVLKNSPEDEGFNGNYALSAGYGRGGVGNANLSFNFRKDKVNAFGGYSYVRNGKEQFSELLRRTGTSSDEIKTFLTSERDPVRKIHNARIGLDYQFKKQTTVGVLFSGYLNHWDMEAINETRISPASLEDTLISSLNLEDNDWKHFQLNFNLFHTFNNGSSVNADFDYLFYDNRNPTNYDLSFRNESGSLLSDGELFSGKDTPFNILVAKVDHNFPVSEKLKLSSGIKYVQSDFENDVLVTRNTETIPEFTSVSNLTEIIFAAYTQSDYKLNKKTTLKAGLRYEHTDTDLNTINEGSVIDRTFGKLFPSLFISHNFNEDKGLNISYSKRINRPAFNDMAPFIIFLDPNTLFGGNAALQPAISHVVQTDFSYKDFSFSAQYTLEDSTIVRFQNRFNPKENTQFIIPDNLKRQQTVSASITFPLQITDWWNMRYFTTYVWQKSTSVEELGTFKFDQHNVRFNGTQSFKLPKNFSIELSGFFQTSSLVGNVKFDPFGILNFGLQKKLKNNARITFNITDVFNSLKRIGETDLANQNLFVERTFDFSQRTFKLTFSGAFGNQKLKGSRNRNSGVEVKKRIN